jgi:hypothetical protein
MGRKSHKTYFQLCLSLSSTGQTVLAEENLEQAKSLAASYQLCDDQLRVRRNFIELYVRTGYYEKALEIAQRVDQNATEAHVDTFDIRLDWVPRIHLLLEQFPEAQKVLVFACLALLYDPKKRDKNFEVRDK